MAIMSFAQFQYAVRNEDTALRARGFSQEEISWTAIGVRAE